MTVVLDAPVPGVPVEVLPGVVRVTAPNPSVMTGPGTNTYLVGLTSLVAIDPGPEDDAHLAALVEACAGRLQAVIVTHTHPDHAPGAAALAAATRAHLLGYGSRDGFVAAAELRDGDLVTSGDMTLAALHTPGHASNHLCYLLDTGGERALFSGDHIMGGSTVVIAPPDGDMAAYLVSLDRLLGLAPAVSVIAPGHGALMAEPRSVIEGYVSHRLAREAAILSSLRGRGTAQILEIVGDVYTDVPSELHPVARYSVWAHLLKLSGDGLARSDNPDDVEASWSAV
jgi:glyoxylase-like metal-dependent hydrolase (beta-lactamase superfamily II)